MSRKTREQADPTPSPADRLLLQQVQAAEGEQQRLRRLLDLNERERRMLAYDVHDGFVQDVVSAQLAIDAMLDRLAVTDPDSVPPLLRVRAFVRKAIDDARRLVGELRPSTTEDRSLVDSIQFLVDEAETAHQLAVKFTFPDQVPDLSPLLVRALSRIVQEALNNVHRHARVCQASVELQIIGSRLALTIQDRGVGFRVAQLKPGSFGLEGMRERTHAFQGTLDISSRQGRGTTIKVLVPLADQGPSKGMTKRPRRRKK